MNPKGDRCLCAAWKGGRRGGVGCYETATGEVVWHRPELKPTQYVSYAPSGDFIWWMPHTGPVKQLNAVNGDRVRELRATDRVFEDRYSKALFIAPRNEARPYLFGESSGHRILRHRLSVFDVAFAPDCFCITEGLGPARCFASLDGADRWRYEPPPGSHIVHIRFVEALDAFFGILYNFNAARHLLVRLNPTNGTCYTVCDVRWSACFCETVGALVTSSGAVIRLNDGKQVGHLDFPQTDIQIPRPIDACACEYQR